MVLARRFRGSQRHGANANRLFTWRRQEGKRAPSSEAELIKLVPVTVTAVEAPPPVPIATPESIGRMEIVLAGGERIIVGSDVDAPALARVVKALTRR